MFAFPATARCEHDSTDLNPQVVVFHDENCQRLLGMNVPFSELHSSEIPEYQDHISNPFVPGSILRTSGYDRKAPLLEEVALVMSQLTPMRYSKPSQVSLSTSI